MRSVQRNFLVVLALAICSPLALSQTVITNSTATPAGCDGGPRSGAPIGLCTNGGNYILGGDVGQIDVVGDTISIDLNGFFVGVSGAGCPDATIGNTCSGAPGPNYGFFISGKNARVKNGQIKNVSGSGVTATGENVYLSDLSVHDNRGDGIVIGTGQIRNVQSANNNGFGLRLNGGTVDGAFVSHNNNDGIYGSGFAQTISNSISQNNTGNGVFIFQGQTTNVTSYFNGAYGFGASLAAQFVNSTAIANGVDGFNTLGAGGGVVQSLASGNTGYGFNLSSTTCYQNVSTVSNTAGTVNGGAAYGTGTVCAH